MKVKVKNYKQSETVMFRSWSVSMSKVINYVASLTLEIVPIVQFSINSTL